MVAKSYTRKGFLIYEEMRKYFPIYEDSLRSPLVIYDFATAPFWISLYMRKILVSFLSVHFVSLFISWLVSVWEGCCLAHLSTEQWVVHHRISHFQMLSTTWHFNLRPSLREDRTQRSKGSAPARVSNIWHMHAIVHCKDICTNVYLFTIAHTYVNVCKCTFLKVLVHYARTTNRLYIHFTTAKANLTVRKIRFCKFYYFSRFNEFNPLTIRTFNFFIKNSDINGPCR